MKKIIVLASLIAVAAYGAKKLLGAGDEPIEYFPPAEQEEREAA